MKLADIDKLRAAGLISDEQRQRIISHFRLGEETSRLLIIFSLLGGVLVALGLILLVAANWDEIPRGVKISTGLALMLGSHLGGMQLRRHEHPIVGEGLHLLGSMLFLGNIALVGQIYHLSSRPGNAFLLWLAGLAALPWVLRSKPQHVLSLLAFGIWAGVETDDQASWLYLSRWGTTPALFALLGLCFTALAGLLAHSREPSFASPTHRLGLLAFHVGAFPLTFIDKSWGPTWEHADASFWLLPALAAIGIFGSVATMNEPGSELPRQWRWTWLGALAVISVLILAGPLWAIPAETNASAYHWFLVLALVVFCLLELQVGVLRRSAFQVNLGMALLVALIIRIYVGLFGTMGATGLVFIVGGVALIGLGFYLERKRRALIRQIRITSPS